MINFNTQQLVKSGVIDNVLFIYIPRNTPVNATKEELAIHKNFIDGKSLSPSEETAFTIQARKFLLFDNVDLYKIADRFVDESYKGLLSTEYPRIFRVGIPITFKRATGIVGHATLADNTRFFDLYGVDLQKLTCKRGIDYD